MINSIVTTELENFGPKELDIASEILSALAKDNCAEEVKYGSGLRIMFNCKTGYVFLTNDDFETWMLTDGELDRLFYCQECGDEILESDIEEDKTHALNPQGNDIIHSNQGERE